MEQMVGTVAQRLFEVLVVQLQHILVLMGVANLHVLIDGPQHITAVLGHFLAVVDGLTTAAGAAAGTGHHFHEIVADLAVLQGVHQAAGIAQTTDNGHADGTGTGDGEGGFLPAIHAADGAEGIGAGGIVGTIQFNPSDEGVSIENVVAVNAGLSASNNNVAIGGIAGAIGANNIVQNAIHRVTAPMTIRSKSAVEGFTAPNSTADRGNFHLYGGGGIAGYNNGKIMGAQVKTESTFRLTINGSMVGGIVGVNFGTVDSSSVQARIFTSRQRSTSYEGGAYGGMIGFNVGTISNSSISGTKTATNDYDSTSAAYELTTGSEAYVPTSGANGGMHGDAGKDTTNIYVGGVVGYNEGTISAVTNNSKLMVNKRSNDSISNYSYVGAIAGSSTNSNISASGTAIIKYFHYLWVDPASGEDVENPMTAYIGNGSKIEYVTKDTEVHSIKISQL